MHTKMNPITSREHTFKARMDRPYPATLPEKLRMIAMFDTTLNRKTLRLRKPYASCCALCDNQRSSDMSVSRSEVPDEKGCQICKGPSYTASALVVWRNRHSTALASLFASINPG